MTEIENALMARDFASFVRACHKICHGNPLDDDPYLIVLFAWAEDIIAGQRRHSIINLPPGVAKSFIFAICLPAWALAQDPTTRVLIVEHDKTLAAHATRNILKILTSEKYRRAFKTRIDPSRRSKVDFGTTKGGGVLAASIKGGITGYRADLVIADDLLPIKYADNQKKIDWVNKIYVSEIASRGSNTESRFVVVMHRLSKTDLTAKLRRGGEYDVLEIPMVAEFNTKISSRYGEWRRKKGEQIRPGLYSKKKLNNLSTEPFYDFLYQQDVGKRSKLRVKAIHFKFTDEKLDRSKPFIFSIDAAQKATPSGSRMAIQVWQICGSKFRLVDIFTGQCDFMRLWQALNRLLIKYPPSQILVEDTASGSALISQLSAKSPCNVQAIIPKKSKSSRFFRHLSLIRRSRIVLPEGVDWASDWIEELVSFPAGEFDDHVDCLSMFLDFAATKPLLEHRPRRKMHAAIVLASQSNFGHSVVLPPSSLGLNPITEPSAQSSPSDNYRDRITVIMNDPTGPIYKKIR